MLTLPIKKKWYDMILSGEKEEEYRDITPYYNQRFARYLDVEGNTTTTIKLRNGYSKDSPTMICDVKIDIDVGLESWGAQLDTYYYVLRILNRKEIKHA